MSSILVGNTAELKSVAQLSFRLQEMAGKVSGLVTPQSSVLGVKDGICSHFSELEQNILSVIQDIKSNVLKHNYEFLVTFRSKIMNPTGSYYYHTAHFDFKKTKEDRFPFIQNLQTAFIPELSFLQDLYLKDILVKINDVDFETTLKNMMTDTMVINGFDILIRSKESIKLLEDNQKHLREWTPLPDSIQVFVARFKENVEDIEFNHLQDVLSKNGTFSIDSNGDIFINV